MQSTASTTFIDEQVYFYPFEVFESAIAVKMSYLVGATAAGNVDLGIYDAQENKLVSTGLTAQGTINTLQEFDITDTLLLPPGVYFMAIKCTDGTGTSFATSGIADELWLPHCPMYIQATSSGSALPDPAVFALDTTTTMAIRLMGIHFSTLI